MTQAPRLTFFFIVEPPKYQLMACFLAASIRENFGDTVRMVGYCPKAREAELSDEVLVVLDRLRCDMRFFETEGRFDPPYPHGNKMLATLERRDTEYSCFLDSDILFLRPNTIDNLICPGHVSLTPAASMGWSGQDIWPKLYDICGMELPEDRIRLMNQRGGKDRMPYFSSGLYVFPEQYRTADGKSFAEVWMDVASQLDANPEVPAKRPYLDQMSLPMAIRKAGLNWNILPREQHYILGGMKRGEPLPTDREVFAVHYRNWDIVKEYGLARQAKTMLERHAGVRRISQVSKQQEAAQ